MISVPNPCSETLRRLIESLFITHAECKLNQTGHLIQNISIQIDNTSYNRAHAYNRLLRPL
jgi:hypothetical protein